MIPNMRKLSAILKSECTNTSQFLFLLKRNIKEITTLLYTNIIYSANDSSGFDGFPILSSYNNDVKET